MCVVTTRTRSETVTFREPFTLPGLDEVLPAGAYSVETDEELLQGVSFPVYRRVLSVIRLPAEPGRPGIARSMTIDPGALAAALERDAAEAEPSASGRSGS